MELLKTVKFKIYIETTVCMFFSVRPRIGVRGRLFLRRQESIHFNLRLKYQIDNGFKQEKHLNRLERIAETLFQHYQIPSFAEMTF